MRYQYELTIAWPKNRPASEVLAEIAPKFKAQTMEPNASANGQAAATHYLINLPLGEYMKDNFLSMDKQGMQYKLVNKENGEVMDEVAITLIRILEEE